MKIFRVLLLCAALVTAGASAKAAAVTADKKAKSETVVFDVSIHCEACKAKIEKNVTWEKGVKDMTFDLEKKQVAIKYDPRKTDKDKLKKALEKLGYTVSEAKPEPKPEPAK